MNKSRLFAALAACTASAWIFSGCEGSKNVPVESVSLSSASISMKVGEETVLTATVLPTNATDARLTWASGNPSVASVTDGVVKGLAEGTSTISAVTADGNKTASCLVTVSDYHAESIILSPADDQSMRKGETLQLTATVLPENAVNKSVSWSSSSEATASVDAYGKVTATGGGDAVITAKTVDGEKTASVKIHVAVPCEGIALSANSVEFYEGIQFTELRLSFTPEDCSDREVELSYDTAVLTVSAASDGTFTIMGNIEGETVLKVTAKDGGFTAECKIKVLPTGTTIPDDNYGKYE